VNFAATSGIHTHEDAIKALLVGANVTMMTSAVLRNGAEHFSKVERGLLDWLTEREYDSVEQMRGSLSQINCPDESAYERAQYARAVSTLPPEYVKYLKR
jgi:dihydroorotate dehydrogenase (fumarate)